MNENFEPYSAFMRIDRNSTGFIAPRDLLNFIRDNGVSTNVTEADCYYVIKFFDSDVDGKLHYVDFMQVILPIANSKLRSTAS
jgi:Ca2+-binding EF-hand superfamily protein